MSRWFVLLDFALMIYPTTSMMVLRQTYFVLELLYDPTSIPSLFFFPLVPTVLWVEEGFLRKEGLFGALY